MFKHVAYMSSIGGRHFRRRGR